MGIPVGRSASFDATIGKQRNLNCAVMLAHHTDKAAKGKSEGCLSMNDIEKQNLAAVEKAMRAKRGLVNAELCMACEGWGVVTYPTTTTWYNITGADSKTMDVCVECWGSGNADNPWPSHQTLKAE